MYMYIYMYIYFFFNFMSSFLNILYEITNYNIDILYTYKYFCIYHNLFLIFSISILILFCVIYNSKLIMSLLNARFLILICFLMLLLLNNNPSNFFIFDYLLVQDEFNIFIQNILILNFIFCVFMSFDYIFFEKIVQYEYFLLLGLSLLGVLTIVQSNDLITLYLAIELQSLAFYVLASFKVYSNFSTEAGLKYFILGAFSSGILLLGSSLIYGFTGTTNFSDLQLLFFNEEISDNIFNGLLLGVVFVTIGILFKLGVAPFHM